MTNIDRFFSNKDFFYYYVSGVLWLLSFIVTMVFIFAVNLTVLDVFQSSTMVAAAFTVVGSIILPYVTGFVLSPISFGVTYVVRRIAGNAIKYVIDYPEDAISGQKKLPKGSKLEIKLRQRVFRGNSKRLSIPMVRKLFQVSKLHFGYELENKSLWFFQMRLYLSQKDPKVTTLLDRAYDLLNLAENILIPFPLLVSLVVYIALTPYNGWKYLSILVFLVLFYMIALRYTRLREHWVKQVYRTYLITKENDIK